MERSSDTEGNGGWGSTVREGAGSAAAAASDLDAELRTFVREHPIAAVAAAVAAGFLLGRLLSRL